MRLFACVASAAVLIVAGSLPVAAASEIDVARQTLNVARSAADIAAHFNHQFVTAPAGLVGNWKLDEPRGSLAVDHAGSNDATRTGGATFSTLTHPEEFDRNGVRMCSGVCGQRAGVTLTPLEARVSGEAPRRT
jgi:hypothetical protein